MDKWVKTRSENSGCWFTWLPNPGGSNIANSESLVGNHDGVTLDPAFSKEFGDHFHNNNPQSHEENLRLFVSNEAGSQGVMYLSHEAKRVVLKDGRTFKVFGSPWSKKGGMWGFGYDEPNHFGESMWTDIPADTDVCTSSPYD